MATLDQLMLRLRELYARAILSGDRVADKYLLVIVETEQATPRRVAEARLTAIQSALQYAFGSGEAIVTVPPRRAVALVASDEPQLTDSLARLRGQLRLVIADRRIPRLLCWRLSLPRDPDELSFALRAMAD